MKQLKLFIAVAFLAGVAGVHADDMRWAASLNSGDGATWSQTANWYNATTVPWDTHAPAAADVVNISDNLFGNPLSTMPVVSTAGQQITQLVLGSASAGQLDIVSGGHLTVSSGAYISNVGAGTLSLSGSGFLLAGNLVFGNKSVAGTVNMSGDSILHAGALTYLNGDVTSTINMTGDALFLINGNQSGLGLENSRIVASGAGESIQMNYDSVNVRTEYTVIPEPATLSLVALMGGGLLMVRRCFMI
jgi:hypothetical protein